MSPEDEVLFERYGIKGYEKRKEIDNFSFSL
jgi:hypothetical protein